MKNPYFITAGLFAILGVALLNTGCNKDSNSGSLATVATNKAIVYLSDTSAQSGGSVTNYGSAIVTADGVCWSASNTEPTIADAHTSDVTTLYNYTSKLTGLTANTTYYVRAYAQNSFGVAYGDVVKFTTSALTADTAATVSTFAGSGNTGLVNGTGISASFYYPQGMGADAQGNLYVADSFNHLIRKVTPAGVVSTFAGSGTLGFLGGPATEAQFHSPQGVVVDATGNVYVSDEGDNAIFKITPAGNVSIFAGSGYPGYANGSGSAAQFNAPQGLAVDAAGNVYVADKYNNRIRKITPQGVVTTVAGTGSLAYIDDAATIGIAAFNQPTGVAIDAGGNIYVADMGNHAIRKVSNDGSVSTLVGNTLQTTLVNSPTNLVIDAQGNLYITDQSGRVMELTNQNVLYTLAGKLNTNGFADGVNSNAAFNSPIGIALDASKNIFVTDYNNQRIRKINVTTK